MSYKLTDDAWVKNSLTSLNYKLTDDVWITNSPTTSRSSFPWLGTWVNQIGIIFSLEEVPGTYEGTHFVSAAVSSHLAWPGAAAYSPDIEGHSSADAAPGGTCHSFWTPSGLDCAPRQSGLTWRQSGLSWAPRQSGLTWRQSGLSWAPRQSGLTWRQSGPSWAPRQSGRLRHGGRTPCRPLHPVTSQRLQLSRPAPGPPGFYSAAAGLQWQTIGQPHRTWSPETRWQTREQPHRTCGLHAPHRGRAPASPPSLRARTDLSVTRGVTSPVSVTRGVTSLVSVTRGVTSLVSVTRGVTSPVSVTRGVTSLVSVTRRETSLVSVTRRVTSLVYVTRGVTSLVYVTRGVTSPVSVTRGETSLVY